MESIIAGLLGNIIFLYTQAGNENTQKRTHSLLTNLANNSSFVSYIYNFKSFTKLDITVLLWRKIERNKSN